MITHEGTMQDNESYICMLSYEYKNFMMGDEERIEIMYNIFTSISHKIAQLSRNK